MKTDDLCVLDAFQPTLTGMWREACRHIEISESAATIAKLLAEHMPIGQLLVRRVDRNRSCVETVAVGLPAPDYLLPDARSQCSAAAIEEVGQWCRRGEVAHRGKPGWADTPLEALVPTGARGDLLLGPLADSGGAGGVLVITAADDAQFDSQHIELMALLLEPLSTALENDRRLREMAAMRAAAEAEKHSLLSRLGAQGDRQ